MPKITEYPYASIAKSLELAEAIETIGGSCSKETVADKLQMSAISGSFNRVIGSAVKFNLIEHAEGKVKVTQLYKNIKLAYNDGEKRNYLKDSFFSISLFKDLYDRYKGKKVPKDVFKKILIREFNVAEKDSGKVEKHFFEGLGLLDLVRDGDLILDIETDLNEIEVVEETKNVTEVLINKNEKILEIFSNNSYIFHVLGPGLDTKIEIKESEDLMIVEALMNKIKKKIENGNNN